MPKRPRVLLVTEGTYPFIMGGVSTWCDALVTGLNDVDFEVLPITAGGMRRESLFPIPKNTRLAGHLDLWSEDLPLSFPMLRERYATVDLPSALARGLLDWDSDLDAFVEALVWCRRNPRAIRPAFRRRAAWSGFVTTLNSLSERSSTEFAPAPTFDMLGVSELYRLLWWIARSAAYQTPDGEHAPNLSIVTAAGWAAIPAVVHKELHGTPILLTEHGIYLREAYLAAIRNDSSPAARWTASRVSRGLSRLAYAYADRVSPVTEANAVWEQEFGVDPQVISTIYNGVVVPPSREKPPRERIVVAVGRIDPLKDIKTMLRTAALVLDADPLARFTHYGPTPIENEEYARECLKLHAELELGDRFLFAGPTDDPYGVVARADIALLTSISEGSPITVLEAMASGRPVVATAVGGVPEAVEGCGFTARPGDSEALAVGVLRLLGDPALADELGILAYERAEDVFGHEQSLSKYRAAIRELTGLRSVQYTPTFARGVDPSPPSLATIGSLGLDKPAILHGSEPNVPHPSRTSGSLQGPGMADAQ